MTDEMLEARTSPSNRDQRRAGWRSWSAPPAVRNASRLISAYGVLIALGLFILLPLSWMLTVALKPDNSIYFTDPPQWFPVEWHWENFRRALFDENRPFGIYLFNTFWLEIFVILGTVISCALVAYPFARLRFPGRDALFTVVILTMLIPWQGLMIPQFILFLKLGWYGTYLPLIVPSWTGSAFFIFLIRQYMRSIPRELDEAARVDGAGFFRCFASIILPLSRPALTVCAVLTFLGTWNDLLGPVIYLNDNSQFTVAVGLANFVTAASVPLNLLMAANLVTIIPMAVLYFFAQRQLIGGIASLGLKG
jgi:ABC-type glycerol-3-phosphate transport system permease component